MYNNKRQSDFTRIFPQAVTALTILVALTICNTALATPNIQHWETKNGARVFFVEAPELPIVDIQITFDAGAARDGDQYGLALLTNGLLSEGANGMTAEQISVGFESLGAQFGNTAQRDMSMFSLRSLTEPKNLDPALKLLATIISKPDFPQAAFDRERNRLLLAIDQRKQQPDELADEAFYKAVFRDHPYASLPEGTEQTVKALTVNDLRHFYKQYLVANNAVIAMVGDFDRKQAEAVAETLIGGLPAGERASVVPPVPTLDKANMITIEHPSTQTHLLVGQPGMKRGDKDYFALYVGNHILGGSGLVARLSDEIREKRGLSYSTYSYFNPMRSEGPFIMGLQTRNDSAQEALDVLHAEVRKFVEQGPTQAELDAAKKNITGGFPLSIASNKSIVGYIGMIGFYGLPLDYLDAFKDNINKLTVNDIKDAFQRRVNPDKMVTVWVGGSQKSTNTVSHNHK